MNGRQERSIRRLLTTTRRITLNSRFINREIGTIINRRGTLKQANNTTNIRRRTNILQIMKFNIRTLVLTLYGGILPISRVKLMTILVKINRLMTSNRVRQREIHKTSSRGTLRVNTLFYLITTLVNRVRTSRRTKVCLFSMLISALGTMT